MDLLKIVFSFRIERLYDDNTGRMRGVPSWPSTARLQTGTLLQKIIAIFETGNVSDVEALIDSNYVQHQGLGRQELIGAEGFRRVISAARVSQCPQLQVTIEDFVVDHSPRAMCSGSGIIISRTN